MDKAVRLKAEHREDLVAYLDGELPDEELQQIDQLLARNEVARHEVEALARTWELLDLLSRPNATAGFTDRTLTTLKVSELQTAWADRPWFQQVRSVALVAVWVIALAACAVGGFALTARALPNPDAELLAKLPLLRNLDLYLELEDMEFVDALRRQTDFAAAATETRTEAATSRRISPSEIEQVPAGVISTRYREAAGLSQPDRDHVLRNQQTFQQLSPARQAQMVELHRQISLQPEAVRTLIETYAMWLQTLSPGQRDDLRKADSAGVRIALVRKFKAEQDANRETQIFDLNIDLRRSYGFRWPFPSLSSDDLAVVMDAVKQEFDVYEQRRIDALPTLPEKYVAIMRLLVEPGRTRRLSDEAILKIIDTVPDENIRRGIRRTTQPEEQRRELLRRLSMGVSGLLAEEMKQFMPTEKDLQELFVSDKITGDERYALMQMSPRELSLDLVRRHLEQSSDPQLKRLQDLQREFRELMFREGAAMFGPRPGGYPGSRGGRPGGGQNPDGRGGEGRGGADDASGGSNPNGGPGTRRPPAEPPTEPPPRGPGPRPEPAIPPQD